MTQKNVTQHKLKISREMELYLTGENNISLFQNML